MNPFDKVTLELNRKITSLAEENAALKEQVAQLTGWKETAEGLLREGRYQELCQELTTLQAKSAALVDASQLAADQIRKYDYTPARSTLLVALAAFKGASNVTP